MGEMIALDCKAATGSTSDYSSLSSSAWSRIDAVLVRDHCRLMMVRSGSE